MTLHWLVRQPETTLVVPLFTGPSERRTCLSKAADHKIGTQPEKDHQQSNIINWKLKLQAVYTM